MARQGSRGAVAPISAISGKGPNQRACRGGRLVAPWAQPVPPTDHPAGAAISPRTSGTGPNPDAPDHARVIAATDELRRALGVATSSLDPTGLEPLVARALHRMRAALADHEPSAAVWHWVARGLEPADDASALDERRWEDLALLDALRQDHPAAVALVNGPLRQRVLDAAQAQGADPNTAHDLFQARLARLLGAPERIGYTGRGHLASWLKRCVINDWLNHTKREARLEPDDALARILVSPHPEPELVSGVHARTFREALLVAFEAIDPADRQLLRLIHVDELSAQQAGAILGLHRVSIQRRLALAREALRARTKAVLSERFGLAQHEVSTLIRSLLDGFHVTVSRLLGSESE